MKQSSLKRMVDAMVKQEIDKYEVTRMQLAQDAACMAAAEIFGMGKGRAKDFCIAFRDTLNNLCTMILEDRKDDANIEYAKAVIDRRLKEIVGDELFVPFNERYGWR